MVEVLRTGERLLMAPDSVSFFSAVDAGIFNVSLEQRWATGGPGATGGPIDDFIRPSQ